jgi:hypothetical protein
VIKKRVGSFLPDSCFHDLKLAISLQFLPTSTHGEMAHILAQITGVIALETNYDILMCMCKNFRLSYHLFFFFRRSFQLLIFIASYSNVLMLHTA